jgi:hypothetical protein
MRYSFMIEAEEVGESQRRDLIAVQSRGKQNIRRLPHAVPFADHRIEVVSD